MYEVPFTPGMIVVSYTDGIAHAGRKRTGHEADFEKIMNIVRDNTADDVEYIARSILEYALSLDEDKASDDMTVVVLGIAEGREGAPKIEELKAVYPV